MAQGDVQVTIIGNLTADPELRFTQSGAAVANFTVVSSPRVKKGDQWEDGDPLFMRCNIWRQAAENVAESLVKGTRVIVTGRLKQRSYDTREGEKRTIVELEADEVAPSLKFATASVRKATRTSDGGSGGGFSSGSAPADDPWGSAPPSPQGYGSGFNETPPF